MKIWRIAYDAPLSGLGYLVWVDDTPLGPFLDEGSPAPAGACYRTLETDVAAPAWVASIQLPPPVPAPPLPVPARVPLYKLRSALHLLPGRPPYATKLDEANALATAVGGDVAIGWEYAEAIDRASPTLAAMLPRLGITPAETDAIFIAADGVVL